MKKIMKFSWLHYFSQSKKQFLILIVTLCVVNMAYGASGVSVSNSNWTNAATWSFNGLNRLPNCSDSITIGSSYTVTVNSQVDYSTCAGPMIIYVYGILEFTNGNKLDLPCGSVVYIMSGGLIRKSTAGGGSSTLISICGFTEWKAGDGPLSGVDTLGTVITLPVELINFEAKKIDKDVKLYWSTATEVNNEFFTLERSKDGRNYVELEKIIGVGNSSFSNSYSYVDNDPLVGISYYRLSQTDFDGKKVTFPPVAMRNDNEKRDEVLILRNPFYNTIEFSTSNIKSGDLQISIFAADGSKVLEDTRMANRNSIYTINNLEKLTSGVYFLQIIQDGQLLHSSGIVKH